VLCLNRDLVEKMSRLENKIALITGAAQGIGAATARAFAEQGALLALFDIKLDALNVVAKELRDTMGADVITRPVDVTNQKAVNTAIESVVGHFGRLDILVNNAGINVFGEPVSLSKDDWRKCFAADLEGAWHCTQAALPSMLAQSYGHIVNVASVHGHKIIRGAFPYPVAKHGLIGMTKALGIEYADRGIRVNSVSPGLIDTPLAQAHFDSLPDPVAARKSEQDILPCKRFGQAQEVANTILFLACDEARFINATDILIDGGRSQLYCD